MCYNIYKYFFSLKNTVKKTVFLQALEGYYVKAFIKARALRKYIAESLLKRDRTALSQDRGKEWAYVWKII